MIAPRRIVVTVRNTLACRTVLDAGEEFARLFGVPVHGQVLEDRMAAEICDLPLAFLPRSLSRRPGLLAHQAMGSAIADEMRRVEQEMARAAARPGSPHRQPAPEPASGPASGPASAGDLVVTAVDLSEPSLGPAIAAAAGLCPAEGGVLVVPERHPSRSGAVVALARDPADRAADVAARIAASLGSELLLVLSGAAAEGAPPPGTLNLPAGQRLTHQMIQSVAVRLLVLGTEALDRLELERGQSPVHHYRTPLLILGPSSGES